MVNETDLNDFAYSGVRATSEDTRQMALELIRLRRMHLQLRRLANDYDESLSLREAAKDIRAIIEAARPESEEP